FFESSSRSIFVFEHDLFRKTGATFPDHALGLTRRGLPRPCGRRRRAAPCCCAGTPASAVACRRTASTTIRHRCDRPSSPACSAQLAPWPGTGPPARRHLRSRTRVSLTFSRGSPFQEFMWGFVIKRGEHRRGG